MKKVLIVLESEEVLQEVDEELTKMDPRNIVLFIAKDLAKAREIMHNNKDISIAFLGSRVPGVEGSVNTGTLIPSLLENGAVVVAISGNESHNSILVQAGAHHMCSPGKHFRISVQMLVRTVRGK